VRPAALEDEDGIDGPFERAMDRAIDDDERGGRAMKLQTNRQTRDGVWGVMLTAWEGSECVFSRWLSMGEWDALVDAVAT
jgi:hypothetical protein